MKRLFGVENLAPYVKDAFHEYLIRGRQDAVNPAETGTKAAALYRLEDSRGRVHDVAAASHRPGSRRRRRGLRGMVRQGV